MCRVQSVELSHSVQSVSFYCCLDELEIAANKVHTSHLCWQSTVA